MDYTISDKMQDKKKEILKILRKKKRLSTSLVAGMINISYKYAKKYLEELEEENMVIREKETRAIYWSVVGFPKKP